MKQRTKINWELETDFVSIGSGIGGLSGAITAVNEGLKAVIFEKSDLVGGITAFSFGEVWIGNSHVEKRVGLPDSFEDTVNYLNFLSSGFAVKENQDSFLYNSPLAAEYFEKEGVVRWKIIKDFADYYFPKAPGAKAQGRFLEVEPFPAKTLGEWQSRTRLSPHVPYGLTHDDMFGRGGPASMQTWDYDMMNERLEADERCLGPGLAASFIKGALDRKIPIYTQSPVEEIISDADGNVIGVRAKRDGKDFYVRARKGVLVATSGYDGNKEFARYYEALPEWETATIASTTAGDNLRLSGELGAATVGVPQSGMAILIGFHIPGEKQQDGSPLYRLVITEPGLPHAMLVNQNGKRFSDESFYRDVISAMRLYDGQKQTFPNFPCYLIVDQRHRNKYPMGSLLPGQSFPEGFGVTAKTIRELGEKLEIDQNNLESTVDHFNEMASKGIDDDFHRGEFPWSNFMAGDLNNKPNPNLGSIENPPFYGIRLTVVGVGINSFGLKINDQAQVINSKGNPIVGLYAAGNAAAYLDTGAGYQSGFANTRGMTYGWLAAKHVAGNPSRAVEAHQTVPGI